MLRLPCWWSTGVMLLASSHAVAVTELDLRFDSAPAPNTYAVTVKAVVDVPPAAVRTVILHNCDYRARYAYMKECALFAIHGTTAWNYTLLSPPVISARDYVSVRTVEQDLAPDGSGVLRMRFTDDHAVGPMPRDGVIRVQINRGYYSVEPVDGGKKSRVTYHLEVNPGGSIPIWMVRLAARRAAPEQLTRIEALGREVVAQNQVDTPVAGAPWSAIKVTPLNLKMRGMPTADPAVVKPVGAVMGPRDGEVPSPQEPVTVTPPVDAGPVQAADAGR